MENPKKSPITVGATEGKAFSVVGDTYRILVGGAETNGAFAAIDMLIPPGGGPGPHEHSQIEESFYVIDGEIEVKSEFGEYIATKGSFVNIPKGGVVHGFKNKTDKIAHLLCIVVPSGLETFFEEIGKPVGYDEFLPPPPMDPESVKKLLAIAEKHGQKVYPPNYLDKIDKPEHS
ncbi:cupin domain-containing protein [Chitinophaga sp. RCC_12]|uniref:cupin domain-containing protein n=1 Tax=Chitinophaga sp. RCC_12 TaxID=3239226 RepID=UPI003526A7D4